MTGGTTSQDHAPAAPWRRLRFTLGVAQMLAAVGSLILLARTGVTPLSLAAVAVTCLLTTASVALFGSRRR